MYSFYKGFGSDNQSGVHPDVMRVLAEVNEAHSLSYGYDEVTKATDQLFEKEFGEGTQAFYVFNGTGANITALGSCLRRTDGVIGSEHSHIFNDESNAPFLFTGAKYIPIKGPNGKLCCKEVTKYLENYRKDEHRTHPAVITLTQPNELGVLYSCEEVKRLADIAHDNKMRLHVDGARIFMAATSLKKSLRAITKDLGVDILSFGGTKNGMMYGEAIISFTSDLGDNILRNRKAASQLASKNRFIAAQFSALLQGDLGMKIAKHANEMALLLSSELKTKLGIEPVYPVDVNMVFVALPKNVIELLQKEFNFYTWDNTKGVVRLVCSFDTTRDEVYLFVERLKYWLEKTGVGQ